MEPGLEASSAAAGEPGRVVLRLDGPAARLLIDHAARRNAFTRAMWRSVPGLVAQACAASGVRVLCLQSAVPGAFAAGADISEFEATYGSAEQARAATAEIHRACEALEACPLPTLALIDGPCVGGGVALAVACDMRIAGPRARFGVTPARLGLSYAPDDLRRLLRACGWGAASELLHAGRIWSAERALRAGLVNELHGADDFEREASALVDAIAASSLQSTLAIKRGLRAAESGQPAALQAAADEFTSLFLGTDFIEGRDAFLQKRPAAFPSHRSGLPR